MTIDSGQQALAADILKHANSDGYLQFTDSTELTISAGAVTAVANFYRVDTESNASTDDLDTITAGTGVADGHVLFLRAENDARTVVIKHNTGNIQCANGIDIVLDGTRERALLHYDGNLTKWIASGPQSPIYQRQGGSASDWSTPGTTDYSVGATRVLAGATLVTILNGNTFGSSSVAFPVAYSQDPLAISGLGDCPDRGVYSINTEATTTGLGLTAYRPGTSGTVEVWVNWRVEGPP